MTLSSFITKYKGKAVDFDGAYQGQCVDLFRQYVQEVLAFPQPKGVSGAKDFWAHYETDPALKNYYDKIANTATFIPNKGDVMIWDKSAGEGFGHIAIVADGKATSTLFTSFDQNWSKVNFCELVSHNYDKPKVLGVLRPKYTEPPEQFDTEFNRVLAYIGVKTGDELMKTWDQEMGFLKSEREKTKDLGLKNSQLRDELGQVRAEKSQVEKESDELWDTIMQHSPTSVKRNDKPSLVAYLTEATQNEDKLVTLQKTYDEAVRQHKEDLARQAEQISTLSAAVDRLMQENKKLREEAEKLGSGEPTVSFLDMLIRWFTRKKE